MLKKLLCLLICFSIIFIGTSTLFASNVPIKAYSVSENTIRRDFTDNELSMCQEYNINVSTNIVFDNDFTCVDFLQLYCIKTDESQIQSLDYIKYLPNGMSSILTKCQDDSQIVEIYVLGEVFSIKYRSDDNYIVVLSYTKNGLMDRIVYDESNDIIYVQQNTNNYVEEHFREGSICEITDEYMNYLDEVIENDDIDKLKELQQINVSVDDSCVIIEPNLQYASGTSVDGFSNESDLLTDLKLHWPEYTDTLKYSCSVYSYAMSSNVNVQVKETRNTYTKKSTNFLAYASGTALSVISIALSLETGIVANILSLLSVGISSIDTILQSVNLAKSASYTYVGKRSGYVYYAGNYINMLEYSSRGEFHGGYLSTGVFDWIEYTQSSAFSHPYVDIANGAVAFFDNWMMY